jgi:hypothetical protein
MLERLVKTTANVVALYGQRFAIEEAFRDTKDLHFEMGLSATHIRNATRRDRMLMLVSRLAHDALRPRQDTDGCA